MLSRLVRHGYDIHLLVPNAPPGIEPRDGIAVSTFANVLAVPGWLPAPLRRAWMLPAFWGTAARAATRLARQLRPAIVMGFSHYGAWPAFRAGRAAGAPSVLKLFGVMHAMRLDWPLPRYLYHALEGVLAFKVPVSHFIILNDGTQGDRVARRWGVPPERITYLPNGIDVEWADRRFDRERVRAQRGAGPTDVVFLSLTRLVDSKRVDRIIDAMATLPETARAVLWIAGDGPLRATLETRVQARRIATRFLGTVPHADVPHVLAACDVFVSTSTLTNMSIPTCEAMVLGRAVVALDVGGTSEVVHHESTGLLIAEDDARGLAAALQRLAVDAALRDRLGTQAREFARAHFMGWDARVGAEIALLDRLAGSNAPRERQT
jgi:glycosyltransferase involved in cell wall biosynthesis